MTAAAILVIGIAAGFAIDRWCIQPYSMNIVKKTVERRTLPAFDQAGSASAAIVARTNLEMIARAGGDCSRDIDVCMEVAANERILGHDDRAIAAYQAALKLDRRPEIFYDLAITQLTTGDREHAIENLALAIRFYPEVGYIPDAEVNDEAHRRAFLAAHAAKR